MLEEWLKERDISPELATLEDLEGFTDMLLGRYKPSTVKLALVQVKGAYSHAHRRGIIPSNPSSELILPKEPDVEPETFSPQELRQMLKTAPSRKHDVMLKLFIFGGLRRIEVCRLKWADVDFAGQTLTVMGKGSKIRKVPMHQIVHEVLKGWQSHCGMVAYQRGEPMFVDGKPVTYVLGFGCHPLNSATLARWIEDCSEASGIHIKSHTFRKSLATDLYERGAREDYIESIMGWAKRTVRQRFYSRVAPEQLLQTILMAYKDCRLV